jgi:hypothetical protein
MTGLNASRVGSNGTIVKRIALAVRRPLHHASGGWHRCELGCSGPVLAHSCRGHAKWIRVFAIVAIAGMVAMGCGSSQSAAPVPASTTTTLRSTSSPDFAWLSAKAEPWNHKLNTDQNAIDAASIATSGANAGTYFYRLGSACAKMLDDASKAQHIVHAPLPKLDGAWQDMAARTKTYASNCLSLVRSHANADLTTWNNSLKAMNSANGTFNAAVAVVRKESNGSTG